MEFSWFKGKRVFVTGHTGFKGSWLCRILLHAGASVTGYALPAPQNAPLFRWMDVEKDMVSVVGDIRDSGALHTAFAAAGPEIVLHMAAQPLVRESYENPACTYETNVMGTVNILECVRQNQNVVSFLNVTTDKVYYNNEWTWGYRENDPLDGYDPYSNSKSCAELVTRTWRDCFLQTGPAVSTARAGNVIGGGDRAADRIIPDSVRAVLSGEEIVLRNPSSVRPYQHVLEPLCAYLLICQKQAEDKTFAGSYNIGPCDTDCVTTGELAELFCTAWGDNLHWRALEKNTGPHEAGLLKLDISFAKQQLQWQPKWNVAQAVGQTVAWEKAIARGESPAEVSDAQIKAYLYD